MLLQNAPLSPIYRRLSVSISISAVLLVFLATSASAQQAISENKTADDLTLRAIVKQAGTWSSNPLMVTTGAESLWGSTTSPELILKSATSLSLLNIDARVDENIFNQTAFNSTDAHTTMDVSTNNMRWMAGIQGAVDYDTTRTSELTNYGLQPILARHTGLFVAPRASFSSSAVDTFSLTGSAATSKYDNTAFTNYETFSITPSYNHQFDPQNVGIFSAQARRYQTTRNNATRVDSWGPSVGWQTIFSSRLKANVSIGAQADRQYSFGVAVKSWQLQYVFSGGLSFVGQQDNLNFAAARSQFPYGNGTDALQTSFSVAESHKLNPLVSLNLGAKYLTSEYQTTTTGNLKSLADGQLGLAYHVTKDLDLTATYRYRYETLTNQDKTAQDNSAIIGLVFHPKEWAF